MLVKYTKLAKGDVSADWLDANAAEWRRLITETVTLRFVPASTKPAVQKATYISLVCTNKIKPPSTAYSKRVRATCGNGIEYSGDTAAEAASLDTVKLLLNSTISDPFCQFIDHRHQGLLSPQRLAAPRVRCRKSGLP